jgi:hypothetical protein
MSRQEDKGFALAIINEYNLPAHTTFMGVDVNEFTKDELIKILCMQNERFIKTAKANLK